jgi:enamine deaminase RidA (YjgF/YER057c/UK114 family)
VSSFQEIPTGNPAHEPWPYSELVRAGDFLLVSGIGAEDQTTGEAVGDTIEAQTRKTFENVESVLSHAGASLRDVCRVSVQLKDLDDFQAFSRTFGEIFHWRPRPTRVTTGAALWPGLLVEVECTAYRPAG